MRQSGCALGCSPTLECTYYLGKSYSLARYQDFATSYFRTYFTLYPVSYFFSCAANIFLLDRHTCEQFRQTGLNWPHKSLSPPLHRIANCVSEKHLFSRRARPTDERLFLSASSSASVRSGPSTLICQPSPSPSPSPPPK